MIDDERHARVDSCALGMIGRLTASDVHGDVGVPSVPTPASQPMSRRIAEWYAAYTKGQLQAGRAADGSWYLYVPVHLGRLLNHQVSLALSPQAVAEPSYLRGPGRRKSVAVVPQPVAPLAVTSADVLSMAAQLLPVRTTVLSGELYETLVTAATHLAKSPSRHHGLLAADKALDVLAEYLAADCGAAPGRDPSQLIRRWLHQHDPLAVREALHASAQRFGPGDVGVGPTTSLVRSSSNKQVRADRRGRSR